MKQLRNRADEDARLVHMSLQMDSELPSSLRKDLDHLMVLVSFDVIFSEEEHLIKRCLLWRHTFESEVLELVVSDRGVLW